MGLHLFLNQQRPEEVCPENDDSPPKALGNILMFLFNQIDALWCRKYMLELSTASRFYALFPGRMEKIKGAVWSDQSVR